MRNILLLWLPVHDTLEEIIRIADESMSARLLARAHTLDSAIWAFVSTTDPDDLGMYGLQIMWARVYHTLADTMRLQDEGMVKRLREHVKRLHAVLRKLGLVYGLLDLESLA